MSRTTSDHPIRPAREQPILHRRRRRPPSRRIDAERLERDFWSHFDLEKLASGWRGAHAPAPTA